MVSSWPLYLAEGEIVTAIDSKARRIADYMPLTVTTRERSLILGGPDDEPEIYDLTRDPGERDNSWRRFNGEGEALCESTLSFLESVGTPEEYLAPAARRWTGGGGWSAARNLTAAIAARPARAGRAYLWRESEIGRERQQARRAVGGAEVHIYRVREGFVERDDFEVLHEPFSASYYYGEDRLSDRYADVEPRAENNYERVLESVLAPQKARVRQGHGLPREGCDLLELRGQLREHVYHPGPEVRDRFDVQDVA